MCFLLNLVLLRYRDAIYVRKFLSVMFWDRGWSTSKNELDEHLVLRNSLCFGLDLAFNDYYCRNQIRAGSL